MIYRIHPDYQHYKSFVLDSRKVRQALGGDTMFHFARRPERFADRWTPFEIEFASLGSGKAEMPDVMVRNGRLFLNQLAHSQLSELCEPFGEFLTVTFGTEKGYLFNVTAVADDALDLNRCLKNEFDEVQAMAFHDDKLVNTHLFRTEYDAYSTVFCSEEFRSLVEEAGLEGVVFSADVGSVFPMDDSAGTPTRH